MKNAIFAQCQHYNHINQSSDKSKLKRTEMWMIGCKKVGELKF